jgi:hypothetical protein
MGLTTRGLGLLVTAAALIALRPAALALGGHLEDIVFVRGGG